MARVIALSEEYGPPLPQFEQPPCLWRDVLSFFSSTPDALAIACVHQPPDLFCIPNLLLDHHGFREKPYLRWSFKSLSQAVDRLIRAWTALGVKEGTALLTFCHNSAEYVLACCAALNLGCVLIPVSPRSLTNEEEVRHMIRTGLSVCSSERPVLIAGDEHLAFQIDHLGLFPQSPAKFVFGAKKYADWTTFDSLMDATARVQCALSDVDAVTHLTSEKGGAVLFTSGTTSLPKGIFRPYSTWALSFLSLKQVEGVMMAGDRTCCNLPNNHAMGFITLTNALSSGVGVVFPGSAFNPETMLETLYTESITHLLMVPTMLHALTVAKASRHPDRPLYGLKNVTFGGSSLTPDMLSLVTNELGADGVENIFGCTEGVVLSSGRTSDPETIVDIDQASVGWPVAGFGVRIVDPGTGETVPRNSIGELHGCGPSVDGPYIGGAGKENWYMKDGRLWYKTGDAGRMDTKGRTFITGRFKDMIIRGGENISPSAIEGSLCKNPHLNTLVPQVVGVKDKIAGEMPICVIRDDITPEIRELIQSQILQNMGPLYIPKDSISIKELGLQDYPRTTSGKVQKAKLAALVEKYISRTEHAVKGMGGYDSHLTETLRIIWAKAVGLEPSSIRLDAPIGEFADSITVMRVRDRIKHTTGKALSLSAMVKAGNIGEQIKLLQTMDVAQAIGGQEVPVQRPTRLGAPDVEDMMHLIENPHLLEPTKELVTQAISSHGLGWEDVEDIIPAYDFGAIVSQTKLCDSWNFNFAIHPTGRTNKAQMRRAFEAVVVNNRILASFLIWDARKLKSDNALHVVIKQRPKFFDIIVEDGGSLDTVSDLKNISLHHPRPDYATLPGPVYRTMLFDINETGSSAMVISVHHCIMDASMGQIIQEDMDLALAAIGAGAASTGEALSKLQPHVDYKPWADSYYNLRSSAEARAATKWHLRRLSRLAQHVKAGALFPSKLRTPRDKYNAALVEGDDSIPISFDVPDIHALRREFPDVTAQAVVKSAVALMNVNRTGHSHALFTNHEAARTYFPFIPESMKDLGPKLYEATDVSGPTYQNVINLIEINGSSGETVLELLKRMQGEQILLTRHAAAPLRQIMAGLENGDTLVPEVIGAQVYNWVPGLGTTGTNPHLHHEVLNAVVRPHLGLNLNCGLGGPQNQTFILQLRGDGFDLDGLRKVGQEVEAITKWLVARGNWTRPVREYVSRSLTAS